MWCLVPGNMIVRVASKNRPGYYWAIDEGIEGYLMTEAEMFRLVSPGLAGAASVSFESVTRPGRFVRHRGGKIWVEEADTEDEAVKRECSWLLRNDHFFTGFVSFESVHQPGFFIRHHSRRLEMTEIFSNQDRNDASFIMADVSSGQEVTVQENWRQYLGRTVEVESKAVPGHYWNYAAAGLGEARLELQSHVFRMVAGLWGDNTVSFESTSSPGFYLRARGDRMWVESVDTREEAATRECSFNVWDDRFFAGYTSFESAARPDQWIRQQERDLRLSLVDGYEDSNDASFMVSEASVRPPPSTTTTTRRPTTRRRTTSTTAAPVTEYARGPSK